MWQPLLITLLVVVSAVMGQMALGERCSLLSTGVPSPNMMMLPQLELRAHETYPIDGKFPCSGDRPIGLYVIACSNSGYFPPILEPTKELYIVDVRTVAQTTVDILVYCDAPITKKAAKKPARKDRFHHSAHNLLY